MILNGRTDPLPSVAALNGDGSTAISILVEMRDRKLVEGKDALVRLSALEKYGRYSVQIMNNARSRLEGKING